MMQKRDFALMSDSELVEGLIALPVDDNLHKYFFHKKCKNLLKYISMTLYNDTDSDALVGELYEFLSEDNWKVLKMWESKNGCSLNSYLSLCSFRYFANKVNMEKKRSAFEVLPSTPEVMDYLNHFVEEEEFEKPPVWDAYNMLKERDRVILRLLVIEEKGMMDAAPYILPYIKTTRSVDELSQKNIQSVISMAKHRALFALLNNLNNLTGH